MKKRLFVLVITAVMLTACANNNSTSSNKSTDNTSIQNTTEAETETETSTNEAVDEYLNNTTLKDEYIKGTTEDRRRILQESFDELVKQGQVTDVYYDDQNNMFSFKYAESGILGGWILKNWDPMYN